MSRPEAHDPADVLRSHLRTIRDCWGMTLPKLTAAAASNTGRGSRISTAKDADNGDHNTDVDRVTIALSLRDDTLAILTSWVRLLVEDYDVAPSTQCTHGATVTLPHPMRGPLPAPRCAAGRTWISGGRHALIGHDIEDVTWFLDRWAGRLAEHEAADDAHEELRDLARRVEWTCDPERPDWMILGECPVEVEQRDGTLGPCGGKVRAWPAVGKERDPRCTRCGTVAVVDWWMSHILGNPSAKALVTGSELVGIIAWSLHWTVTHEQIRQWASRGKIQREGKDSKGRTLYDHRRVVDAVRDDVRAQRDKAG